MPEFLLDHRRLGDLITTDHQIFLACGPSPMEVALYLDNLLELSRTLETAISEVRARFQNQLDESAKEAT